MPDLTTATEIAAKAFHQQITDYADEKGETGIPSWEDLPSVNKLIFREKMLPIVTALAEAGLLKEDQS